MIDVQSSTFNAFATAPDSTPSPRRSPDFNLATAESDYAECGAFHTPALNAAWAAKWALGNPQSPLNRYDAAGNTTGYSTVTATYNNAGRLRTLTNGSTTETSTYNALGQRVKISGGAVGPVLYAYEEAGYLLGEYDSTGALIEENPKRRTPVRSQIE